MGNEGYFGDCRDAVRVGYETGVSPTQTKTGGTGRWMSSVRRAYRCPPPN